MADISHNFCWLFNSKNFTIPDNWILTEPKRNFEGGFSTAGISKIVEKSRKFYSQLPADIIAKLKSKFEKDFSFFNYTFDDETREPSGFNWIYVLFFLYIYSIIHSQK